MRLTTACGEVFEFLRPVEEYFSFPGIIALNNYVLVSIVNFSDDLARQALRLRSCSTTVRIAGSIWLHPNCRTMPIVKRRQFEQRKSHAEASGEATFLEAFVVDDLTGRGR